MPVRFDDRLTTVLAHPAATPHDRAIRWRQLVELAARAPVFSDQELLRDALDEIRAGSGEIDERVRVAAALAIANLPLSADLVAVFASDRLGVAAPVLAGAKLTVSEWKQVASAANDECRAFIAAMRSEHFLSHYEERRSPAAPAVEDHAAIPSISEVVSRIERLRQAREPDPAPSQPPACEESPRLFQWECNEAGEIDWVEGAPRGALVGRSIAQAGPAGAVDPAVQRAFQSRAPFHDAILDLPEGAAVAGSWKISGIPAFEPASGRFAGYRGIAERAEAAGAADSPQTLRELAHEIRTPLNAIIGFAEMITGEYLGPADSSYRERAGQIVAHASLLLAAVEDLDFAAKLRSGPPQSAVRLADALAPAWPRIEREAESRSVRVAISMEDEDSSCSVALDDTLLQRLVERFCMAVIALEPDGGELAFRFGSQGGWCTLTVDRAGGFGRIDLLGEHNRRANDGAALPLRLVRGLARTAGGDVEAGEQLVLRLPRA